jgi:hypothetical protein
MGRIAKEEVKEMPGITIATFDHIQHENEKDTYIKQLESRIKFLEQGEPFNRETYQELHIWQEKAKDLSRMVTVATEDFKALERKYEALKEYAKVIM